MLELRGLEALSGAFSQVIARDDALTITFPAKISDPQNSTIENILDVDITLDVDSVDVKLNRVQIYYASFGFAQSYIGEYEVEEGILEQTSSNQDVFNLLLK